MVPGHDNPDLIHEEKIIEAVKHINSAAQWGMLELSEDMTLRDFQNLLETTAKAYSARFIAEGICPACVHDVIREQCEQFELEPHPILIALCASWALLGAHLANNRTST